MMYQFEFNYKKIRVWINESPDIKINHTYETEKEFIANSKGKYINIENVVCEVLLPKGHANYALLGCKYNSSKDNTVNVKIMYNKECKEVYTQSLNTKVYNTYIGINEECLDGITNGTKKFMENNEVVKGFYLFDIGANCQVGSSISIFESITELLLNILHMENISQESLLEVVRKYF